ncbi:hypothetical protein [Zavarzinia sp. CC-PAN008]|uniref:hypothetical protein n=1 Tax=Zavarzinia sp. CC-PAN008 TaxID=3243332 RepID=UPI003F74A521
MSAAVLPLRPARRTVATVRIRAEQKGDQIGVELLDHDVNGMVLVAAADCLLRHMAERLAAGGLHRAAELRRVQRALAELGLQQVLDA